jgi:hypothetical protein
MDKSKIIRLYLDYFNNWLSVEMWAEFHNLTKLESNYIIKRGRKLCK